MEKSKDQNERPWKEVGWIGAVLVIVGYYLNANQMSACWIIWFIGNMLMGVYCCRERTYPPAVLSFLIAVMNVYGWISWT